MLASTQSPAASSPKTVASPAESSGGVAGGHTSERRPARRRSRSGSNPASVGTSPTLAGPLHSPQEQHCASSWGTSASQSQNSSATRCRPAPTLCVGQSGFDTYLLWRWQLLAILRNSLQLTGHPTTYGLLITVIYDDHLCCGLTSSCMR